MIRNRLKLLHVNLITLLLCHWKEIDYNRRLFDFFLHGMAEISHLLKDLIVSIYPPNVLKPSIVWSYFGHLHKNPDHRLDGDHFYCKICLDKLKAEKSAVTLSSVRKRVGVYSKNSSTENMRHHLLAMHQIVDPEHVKLTNEHVLSMFSRDRSGSTMSHAKERLGYQLTLMCCRDLLSFSIVDSTGECYSLLVSPTMIHVCLYSSFQDFLVANKVVSSKSEIPSRTHAVTHSSW